MQTVAATLTQLCFDDLDAPPVVIGSRNWITPAAELEALFFPQPGWLLDAIHERILPLKGYQAGDESERWEKSTGGRGWGFEAGKADLRIGCFPNRQSEIGVPREAGR